jgi:hypothetical protein
MKAVRTILLLALLLIASDAFAAAAATTTTTTTSTTPAATITLGVAVEEGQKQIRAVVTRGGKPMENVSVVFAIKRTFGNLTIGEDKTLDDGSAAEPFPQDIPGGPTGELQAVAEIKAPPDLAGVRTQAALEEGTRALPPADPFPRALWAPHAPLQLVVPIIVLLGGVWATYLYVIAQIVAIKRGAKQ